MWSPIPPLRKPPWFGLVMYGGNVYESKVDGDDWFAKAYKGEDRFTAPMALIHYKSIQLFWYAEPSTCPMKLYHVV